MDSNGDNKTRTRDWYNEHTEMYTGHTRDPKSSIYHSLYEKPAMYALLQDDLLGLTAVSLGSGSGEDCEELRRRGAVVCGIDISDGLIDEARKAYPNNTYYIGSMDDLHMLADSSQDIVYSSLAVHYLDSWEQLMSEIVRVLKPGGFFLFSMGHPINYAIDEIEVGGEIHKGLFKIKRIDGTREYIGDDFSKKERVNTRSMAGVVNYSKTVQDISDLAHEYDLIIDRIIEPKPLSEMKEFDEGSYNGLLKSPYFIIYKLRKSL